MKGRLAVLGLILTLALSACGPMTPDQMPAEESGISGEQEALKENPPYAELSTGESLPGWVFLLKIENLKLGDQIIIDSDLVHVPTFYRMMEDKEAWYRLVPLDTENAGKRGRFLVTVKRNGQNIYRVKLDPKLGERAFLNQSLIISEELLKTRQEALSNELELFHLTLAKSIRSRDILWTEAFLMPAEGRLSTPFGARRTLNGENGYVHTGIDLANAKGTPIRAANRGHVVLAEALALTGNTIVIDHGRGLFTSYAHLEAMTVEKGVLVERGQEIGAMGSTGFSTGSHLHFTAELQGVAIDPMMLVERSHELRAWMEKGGA